MFIFSGINSNNDHSRRLIQSAYTCFQQLNECEDLSNEQKQWIQTWMDAVANVKKKKKIRQKHNMVFFFVGKSRRFL